MNHDELLAAIGAQPAGRFGKVTSGVDEMRGVLEQLDRTDQLHRLKWAVQERPLYERGGDLACKILPLAPCDLVVSHAHRRLAELLADTTRRVGRPERNDGAVVLWVEVGDATILLGADLQETPEDRTGWTAVVDCLRLTGTSRRSDIFKVPHHGSRNAFQRLVWTHLLVDNPEAVVCPHERGAQVRSPSSISEGSHCAAASPIRKIGRSPPSSAFAAMQPRLPRPGVGG